MSLQAVCVALKADLPTLEKFVLIALANYADEDGKCWPSVGRLVADTGISRRTVFQKLKSLEEKGAIKREQRSNDGAKISSIYYIKVAEFDGCNGSATNAPTSATDARGVVRQMHIEPVNIEPINNPPIVPPKVSRPKRAPSKVPLPEDFALTEKMHRYPIERGIDPDRVAGMFENFCDYHRAKGSVMADWESAWRTWCRNEKAWKGGRDGRKNAMW